MTQQRRMKLLGLCLSVLVIMLIATAFIHSSGQSIPDTDLTHQNKGYAMKVESMTDSYIEFYDIKNQNTIQLSWYYPTSDRKQFKGVQWYYNYMTDTLSYTKNGELIILPKPSEL
jgi:hypothetical protein